MGHFLYLARRTASRPGPTFLQTAMPFLAIAVLLSNGIAVQAQSTLGTITGLVTDSAQAPIAAATIMAIRVDGGSIRSTISTSDGAYSFSDVTPGMWLVKAQAPGLGVFTLPSVQVIANEATRADLFVRGELSVPAPAAMLPNAIPPPITADRGTLSSSPRLNGVGTSLVASSEPSAAHSGDFWQRWLKGNGATMRELLAQDIRKTTPVPDAPAVDPDKKIDPFSDWDWTWLNGNSRQKDSPLDGKYFSGEFRADTHFGLDFNQPVDHTMGGSSELFRSGEVQLEELALGGDFHYDNVRGRVLFLTGLFATTTPRNDASAAVGQWGCARRVPLCFGSIRRVSL